MPEEEYIEFDTEEEEYIEPEEYIEEPPVKRKVVGRIPKQHRYMQKREAPPRPAPAPMQDIYAPPAPMMPFYANPPMRQPVETSVKDRVKADMMYQAMMMREQQRMQMENRPREKFDQKLLRVANQFARGDGGGSNIQIDTTYFRKPKVSVPSPQAQRGARTLDALNNTIRNLAPKAATSSKKRKR